VDRRESRVPLGNAIPQRLWKHPSPSHPHVTDEMLLFAFHRLDQAPRLVPGRTKRILHEKDAPHLRRSTDVAASSLPSGPPTSKLHQVLLLHCQIAETDRARASSQCKTPDTTDAPPVPPQANWAESHVNTVDFAFFSFSLCCSSAPSPLFHPPSLCTWTQGGRHLLCHGGRAASELWSRRNHVTGPPASSCLVPVSWHLGSHFPWFVAEAGHRACVGRGACLLS